MKRLIALCVALVFATGAAGFAVAQEKKAEEKKSEMKSDAKMEKKADKKPATKSASGTLKSASADSIVVAGKAKGKEEEWTFALDAKTVVKKGGKSITAADLKTGDSVSVKYVEDGGKSVAQSVTAKAAPATAKKDDKKSDKAMEAKPAEKK